jgi:hypothetical protein
MYGLPLAFLDSSTDFNPSVRGLREASLVHDFDCAYDAASRAIKDAQ